MCAQGCCCVGSRLSAAVQRIDNLQRHHEPSCSTLSSWNMHCVGLRCLLLFFCSGLLLSAPCPTAAAVGGPGLAAITLSNRIARQLQATDALELVDPSDSQHFPLRTVGQLSNGCTGFLVGPCHVMTVAHCVYEPWRNIWWRGLDFHPGRNVPLGRPSEGWAPLGLATKKDVVLHPNWTSDSSGKKGKPAADAAIIILNEAIGNQLGWLDHKLPQGLHLQLKQASSAQGPLDSGPQSDDRQSDDLGEFAAGAGAILQVAGYPDNKPNGSMWQQCCHALDWDFQGDLLWHDCYVRGGNSGSPVWIEWPESSHDISDSTNHTWTTAQAASVTSRAAGRRLLQSTHCWQQQRQEQQHDSGQTRIQVVGVHSSSLQFPKGSDTGAYAAAVYAQEASRQAASLSSATTGGSVKWIEEVLRQHTCG